MIEQKRQHTKTANIMETAENITKSSKFQPSALFSWVFYNDDHWFYNLSKKQFLFKIQRYF